jgi:hypothetical protein
VCLHKRKSLVVHKVRRESNASVVQDDEVETPQRIRKRNGSPTRALVGARKVLVSVCSHVSRPVNAAQRKALRGRSGQRSDSDGSVDVNVASSSRRPSITTSIPPLDVSPPCTPPINVSPTEPVPPRGLLRKRNPSFVLRQHFAHAAANATNVFRKRRDSDPVFPPEFNSPLNSPSVVPAGPQIFPGRLEDAPSAPEMPQRKMIRRMTSLTFKWNGVSGRARACSLASPLCVGPVMETCDSKATVTQRAVRFAEP